MLEKRYSKCRPQLVKKARKKKARLNSPDESLGLALSLNWGGSFRRRLSLARAKRAKAFEESKNEVCVIVHKEGAGTCLTGLNHCKALRQNEGKPDPNGQEGGITCWKGVRSVSGQMREKKKKKDCATLQGRSSLV